MEARNGKGQTATEYIIMASVVLGAAVMIFYYTMTFSSESISISQARESAENIAGAVDYVYALGPGTTTVVEVEVPANVLDSFVAPKEVGFKVGVAGSVTDVYAITHADATGSIPTSPGRHFILVNCTKTGVVIASI